MKILKIILSGVIACIVTSVIQNQVVSFLNMHYNLLAFPVLSNLVILFFLAITIVLFYILQKWFKV